MQKGILFSLGNKQYGFEIKDDKTVELSRTVIPDDAHYLQSVTTYHTLTYPEVVYDVTVDYDENMVEVKLGNRQEDAYSFGEIESFFVDTMEDKYPSTYLFALNGLNFYVKQLNETRVKFYSQVCNTGEMKASRTASYDHSISRILVDSSESNVVLKVILFDGEVYTYKYHDIVSILYWEDPEAKEDLVNHPSHYQSNQGIEVIQVIGAFTEDLVGMEAVCTANVLKYVCRWKKKNGIEDLKKAEWYLKKLIDIKEAESK